MLVSRCASKPPVQLSAAAMVAWFIVTPGHHLFQPAPIFAEDPIAERDVEALDDLVECFLRVSGVLRPDAQMNLGLARSR